MSPGRRLDRIIRMKAVEREYRVALVAQDALSDELVRDPSKLRNEGLERIDFVNFREKLESSYFVRIYAEFETGLRQYRKDHLKRKVVSRASDMIRSISANQNSDDEDMENVDNVRKYRNKLVHEEDSEAEPVDIGKARKSLCLFFSRLHEDW